jgi:predicted glycosyltransferase
MKGKKVLLVPLNWGLGHATRLVPVIDLLLKKGADVYIAGSPAHLALLKIEFDKIKTLPLPYLRIKLNNSGYQVFNFIFQLPSFLIQIYREHRALEKLLVKQSIDIVISDNCYGLWNRKIFTIFITHQLTIKLPKSINLLEKPVNAINHWFIRKYNICWVPDWEKENSLAGELSKCNSANLKVLYIGPLSRFSQYSHHLSQTFEKKKNQILFIISGPEKQRSFFETAIKKQIEILEKEYTCIVIRGFPGTKNDNLPKGWNNHVSGCEMENLILQSEFIVCRSGYSTIMDLTALRKMAIVVPTPGQTEQEYLAGYLGSKGLFYPQEQSKMDILSGISILRNREKEFPYPIYKPDFEEKIFEEFPFKS